MDPNNPVMQLCVLGMEAESVGRPQNARGPISWVYPRTP
jgi:hypothetical protein